MTCAQFSTTVRALRAAKAPIELKSSWPALVGIESTEPGWQSALLSETSAAATYCGIMKPELIPPSAVRNGGRPSERLGLTRRSTRRSEMLASSETAIASASSPKASGCPWKFPFETTCPSSSSTSGLSVAALSSTVTVPST